MKRRDSMKTEQFFFIVFNTLPDAILNRGLFKKSFSPAVGLHKIYDAGLHIIISNVTKKIIQ